MSRKTISHIIFEFLNGDKIKVNKDYVKSVLAYNVQKDINYTNDSRFNGGGINYYQSNLQATNDLNIMLYLDANDNVEKLYTNSSKIKDYSLFERLERKTPMATIKNLILIFDDNTINTIRPVIELNDDDFNIHQYLSDDRSWGGIEIHITNEYDTYDNLK